MATVIATWLEAHQRQALHGGALVLRTHTKNPVKWLKENTDL